MVLLGPGLSFRFRDLAEIVSVKKGGLALPAKANGFIDADIDEMFEELVKSVIGVATAKLSVRLYTVNIDVALLKSDERTLQRWDRGSLSS